jgi:LysM repeat protein
VAIAVCITVGVVSAAEITHHVGEGESASSIAKRYYGDYEPSELLLEYNRKTGTVIHAGEMLQVPYCDEHRVRAGDTWSVLSQRYLGRADAWPAVALLNDRVPEQPLQVGQRIVFPVVLDHPLARGETLAVLADRYYGERSLSRVLQRFNAIEDPRRLSVGQTIAIPTLSLRLVEDAEESAADVAEPAPEPMAEPQESKAAEPRESHTATTTEVEQQPEPEPVRPRFTDELRGLYGAFADGEFEAARELLDDLRERVDAEGTDAERGELWRLAAFLHITFDEQDRACEAYGTLTALPGPHELDPDLVSPKIRQALARCRL